MENATYLFIAIFISLVITMGTGFLGIKIAQRTGLIDWPGSSPHKQHTRPTPLAGGIALVLSLIITGVIFRTWVSREILVTFLGAAIIFTIGLWDDAKELPAAVKFTGQLVAVIVVMSLGIQVQIFGNISFIDFQNHNLNVLLNWAMTIFWLVGVTNAFNLIDSMDGIVAGLSSLTCLFLMIATFSAQQPSLYQLSAILLGICIGLYFYNASPARFFLGDSGAQTLGFIFAAAALLYSPLQTFQASSWFVPILFMGVPIFDTTLVVYSRLRRREPIYHGSRNHTYHRLVTLGIDPGRAVLIMHLAALSLDCLALIALSFEPVYANIIFFSCVIVGLCIMIILDRRKIWA